MNPRPLFLKAAMAALSIIGLQAVAASPTLPTLPDETGAYETALQAYRSAEADALFLLEDFVATWPASPRCASARLMLADLAFYDGDYTRALDFYRQISPDAFAGSEKEGMNYRRALSLLKTGYYREAAEVLSSLSSSAEYGPKARFYLAYIDYVEGNYDRAYEGFSAARNGEMASEAEYYMNQIDFRRGDYRKVAQTSSRLLQGNVPAYLRAETLRVGGLSYFKTGNLSKAREMLREYVDLTGSGAELSAVYALATILYDDGRLSEALPLFSEVTESTGDLAQSAWLYIGQIYMKQGDARAAAMAFDKASRESWDHDVARSASYNLAVASANGLALPFSDAAKAMEEFVETYPGSPYAASLSAYLANAYYGRRDYQAALRQVDKISNPDAAVKAMRQKILYQLGVSLLQKDRHAEAIGYLRQASAPSQPDAAVRAQASLWLGDALYAGKDYSGAASAFTSAIDSGELGDNTDLAQYNLGYALLKQRSYARAEKAFASALTPGSLSPSLALDARLRRADCLYYTGKYSEALSIFESIASVQSREGAYASIRKADIMGRNGNVAGKIALLEEVAASGAAGPWRATALQRLADAYSENGDDRKAAELYARLLDVGASDSETTQTYFSLATNADNLYRSGDREAALAAYRRLEASGIADLYPSAAVGIMRTAGSDEEVARYARKVADLPGITSEERAEALLISDVFDAQSLLERGFPAEAEKRLLRAVDSGETENNYWLARAYIVLADAYAAQGKDYLAKLYLENLRDNYPGSDKDVRDMINQRLK